MHQSRSLDAYFLVGPTAVGKSSAAQHIAELHDYDILSADSMLVYRGMDIGTAKPSLAERARARYHGIDLTTPNKTFSAWAYRSYALNVLAANAADGRKTIVVGGTGLYIKSLTHGLAPAPTPDVELREHCTRVLKEQGLAALQNELSRNRPDLYESLADKNNPRRLIRALEIAGSENEQPPQTWHAQSANTALAGLRLPAEQLESKIESRVTEMYDHGLVKEVTRLFDEYLDFSATARKAIGYAEAMAFINGTSSRVEAARATVQRTRQLAKRQRTWFSHQSDVTWIDIDINMQIGDIADRVIHHWQEHGPTRIAV